MKKVLIDCSLKTCNLIDFLSVFSFLFAGATIAQTISGRVIDKSSGQPLPFSNVFISNTTLDSTTEINGNFTIYDQFPQNFEMAAPFIGYYTKYRSIDFSSRSNVKVNFDLDQKTNQLDED
jgi:hypothetical protein